MRKRVRYVFRTFERFFFGRWAFLIWSDSVPTACKFPREPSIWGAKLTSPCLKKYHDFLFLLPSFTIRFKSILHFRHIAFRFN
jgi:hypothetical protein